VGVIAVLAVLAALFAEAAPAHRTTATLRVDRVGHAHPAEGSFWNVEIVSLSGGLGRIPVARARLLVQERIIFELAPGRYLLRSYEEHCSENCTRTDPPRERCAKPIILRAGQSLRAAILSRRAGACAISATLLR
jgi:hypothetical protein